MEPYVNTFRIGTDPEFAILNSAKQLVNFTSPTGTTEIGSDHGGRVVELRPSPAYTAKQLVLNIQTLLKNGVFTAFKDYTFRGGGHVNEQVCMGGHVHLELPIGGTYDQPQDEYERRIKACDAVVRTLENLELYPKKEAEYRREASWGRWGAVQIAGGESPKAFNSEYDNYRQHTYKAIYRIEYRTPLSWMFDPKIAYITLAGIKLAAASPITALQMLQPGLPEKQTWINFVDFFRAFSAVDIDAKNAAFKLMNSKHLNNLQKLRVDHTTDFKPRWEAWQA